MSERVLPSPCPKIAKGYPCEACEDLDVINKEIYNAEEVVATLQGKRSAIYSRMNDVHDPITSKLPTEVVSEIFGHFLPENVDKSYAIPMNLREVSNKATTPLSLGAVCTKWRAIAFSTPQLWTSISLDVSYINTIFFGILRKWLDRSGDFPLCIHIYRTNFKSQPKQRSLESLSDLFSQYVQRWLCLDLDAVSLDDLPSMHSSIPYASKLDTLKLRRNFLTDVINLELIPNLRTLSTSGYPLDKGFRLNWQMLTCMEGPVSSADICLELFSRAPFLTSCTIQLENRIFFDVEPTRIIQHDHLAFFQIRTWNAATEAVLLRTRFPALQHLLGPWNYTHSVLEFIQRSGCKLKSLELCPRIRNLDQEIELVSFLLKIPSLQVLELWGNRSFRPIDYLLMRLSVTANNQQTSPPHPNFLPELRKLSLHSIKMSWAYLLGLLSEHSVDDSATTPTGPSVYGVENIRDRVRPLRSLHIEPFPGCLMSSYVAHKLQCVLAQSLVDVQVMSVGKNLIPFSVFLVNMLGSRPTAKRRSISVHS